MANALHYPSSARIRPICPDDTAGSQNTIVFCERAKWVSDAATIDFATYLACRDSLGAGRICTSDEKEGS